MRSSHPPTVIASVRSPPNWVARKLAPVRRKLCATPGYFDQRGVPQSPADLVHHNCLDYTRSGEQGHWRFTGPDGDISVPVTGPLHVDDDEALSQAVLGGLGIAIISTSQGLLTDSEANSKSVGGEVLAYVW